MPAAPPPRDSVLVPKPRPHHEDDDHSIPPDERSALLTFSSSPAARQRISTTTKRQRLAALLAIMLSLLLAGWTTTALLGLSPAPAAVSSSSSSLLFGYKNIQARETANNDDDDRTADADAGIALFPTDFVWGVATSAYQIEGGVTERDVTIWDVFARLEDDANSNTPHILDHSNADTADDHYHRMKSDVALLQSLNIRAYRFSISWARILQFQTDDTNATQRTVVPNAVGLQFYHNLIDELLRHNITPYLTLFHWDLPHALQQEYNGWLDRRCIDAFVDYAHLVFEQFAGKVKHFITINEPWTYAVNGHGSGIHAPGRHEHPTTEPYIVAHHLLLAHAKVYHLYHEHFTDDTDTGAIGMANCGDFRYPRHRNNEDDAAAAERAMLFQWGWFVDPLVYGDYPTVMRQRLGERLPVFTAAERDAVRGSFDFLGLNYYSSLLASTPPPPPAESSGGGYRDDMNVEFSDDPTWKHNDMGWNVVSDGLREMLSWIAERYNNPLILITENGTAEPEPDWTSAQHDEQRRRYFENHLRAAALAIRSGVHVAGYFAWTLMDNFEWQFGYQRRFGLCRVDFDTLERSPKASALWYGDTIRAGGRNIDLGVSANRRSLSRIRGKASLNSIPVLPKRLLVGYGSNCDRVREAVHNGVNCVIWSFLDVVALHSESDSNSSATAKIVTSLNLTAIHDLVQELKSDGFDHVVHLASVGGWNGGHLDPSISALEWYSTFTEQVGNLFHGIDWDLEGNDDLSSPLNYFTLECLDKVGEISELAKKDGLIVGMAPPESYLDIGSSKFSRYVNLTDSDREWHGSFHYFGQNVYAYILQKYGDFIDFVSVQFYESYSRAGLAVHHDGMSPSEYLVCYIENLRSNGDMLDVDFSADRSVDIRSRSVPFPLEKLVFGLANGWAAAAEQEKTLYIAPAELEFAWTRLSHQHRLPRGFMFWTIDEEGNRGIFLAKELRKILDSPILVQEE